MNLQLKREMKRIRFHNVSGDDSVGRFVSMIIRKKFKGGELFLITRNIGDIEKVDFKSRLT